MGLERTLGWDMILYSFGYIVLDYCPIPQVSILNKYSEAIRGNLTKIMRLKIVALVTIEIHARDVLEKLYKSGLMDVNAFDWLSQLRFYWEKVSDGQLTPLLVPNWPKMLFIRGRVLYSKPTLSSLTAHSWQLLTLSPQFRRGE